MTPLCVSLHASQAAFDSDRIDSAGKAPRVVTRADTGACIFVYVLAVPSGQHTASGARSPPGCSRGRCDRLDARRAAPALLVAAPPSHTTTACLFGSAERRTGARSPLARRRHGSTRRLQHDPAHPARPMPASSQPCMTATEVAATSPPPRPPTLAPSPARKPGRANGSSTLGTAHPWWATRPLHGSQSTAPWRVPGFWFRHCHARSAPWESSFTFLVIPTSTEKHAGRETSPFQQGPQVSQIPVTSMPAGQRVAKGLQLQLRNRCHGSTRPSEAAVHAASMSHAGLG